MIPDLHALLARLKSQGLIQPEYFGQLDCDQALEQRDSNSSFDTDWIEAYKHTEVGWSDMPVELRTQIDIIRKEAFMQVSRATRQHEIASYVSDDFDLICRCHVLGYEPAIVGSLWQAYELGKFPTPSV